MVILVQSVIPVFPDREFDNCIDFFKGERRKFQSISSEQHRIIDSFAEIEPWAPWRKARAEPYLAKARVLDTIAGDFAAYIDRLEGRILLGNTMDIDSWDKLIARCRETIAKELLLIPFDSGWVSAIVDGKPGVRFISDQKGRQPTVKILSPTGKVAVLSMVNAELMQVKATVATLIKEQACRRLEPNFGSEDVHGMLDHQFYFEGDTVRCFLANLVLPYRLFYEQYSRSASGLGLFTQAGRMHSPDSPSSKGYPWRFEYRVYQKGLGIEVGRSKTLYRSIANGIAIQVPGYSPDSLSLEVEGATVTSTGGGNYSIKVGNTAQKVLKANVFARKPSGEWQKVNGALLRVADLPTFHSGIDGITSDTIRPIELPANARITLLPPDPDFDVQVSVHSFAVCIIDSNNKIKDHRFLNANLPGNREWKLLFAGLRPGSRVFLHDVAAFTPDGSRVEVVPYRLVIAK